MLNDPLGAKILSLKLIAKGDEGLLEAFNLKTQEHQSFGLVTADCDDVLYVALDEATKKTDVVVVYAKSLYAGAGNASTKLAGEVIGIIAGPTPAEVKSGLEIIQQSVSQSTGFISANEDDSIPYYAQLISRSGPYLAELAQIPEGQPLAYLIAPPLESIYALDVALKAADVKLVSFYGPPSETNFGGGLLTGSQSACQVACEAFAQGVKEVASRPLSF
ncbi:ethanolamine utilization microcompartment protein EutL [Vagococcus salmoninarum]|uniref:Microcompartment protein EutL n=1 Tax=Vagococcus salmoninarum TaxID=2739 RepID=A0A429ZER0_9ENTE|nr:ethanolamine utilization microcompartment protein EutL [Vagococcus salmoninarum]MBE9389223.1 ethanolamine utilization microcompartment protein EutL [Vagococcus salmoninarum]RST92169.1 microcompartment protein EutL [Vagococcus salmoninarum]